MSTRTGKGWIARLRDGLIVVGVTDPAQTMGGRILAAHIKKPDTQIRAGRHVATLESGKWVGGIPVPFGALVVERAMRQYWPAPAQSARPWRCFSREPKRASVALTLSSSFSARERPVGRARRWRQSGSVLTTWWWPTSSAALRHCLYCVPCAPNPAFVGPENCSKILTCLDPHQRHRTAGYPKIACYE